jgi:malonyl-CoA/methylmalonyl-CoA synthetase
VSFVSLCFKNFKMNLANAFWEKLKEDDSRLFIGSQTRKEVKEEASRWMAALKKACIGPGDRVAIALGRSPVSIPVHIAILGVGAAVVPLNQSLTSREISAVLERAEVRLAITSRETFSRSPESFEAVKGSCWILNSDEIVTLVSDETVGAEPISSEDKDPALLLFTSGTTGSPKGVILSHGNLLFSLRVLLIETWKMTDEDRLLHALPLHHLHGLVLGIYGSLLVGNSIILLDRFDAAKVLCSIPEHRITVFMGVPTMYKRMLEAEGSYDLSSMRLFTCGSAPLSPEIFRRFQERFGYTVVERYGLTETSINTSNPPNGTCKPGSVGLPLPGIEVDVFNPESGERLQKGEVGEIWIRGSNVFCGYWREIEATKATFYDDWFRTGDLGSVDPDGYLYILGRRKELIIVGGTNVTPGEVETVLETIPGVEECAVVGLPDQDLGEQIAAFVVTCPGVDPIEMEVRLRNKAERELAPYKRPRSYFFTDTIPRNSMGKVERGRLKEEFGRLKE